MGPARRVIDRPTTIVWLAWALATAWVGSFVARHGYNLPTCDEWAFVRISYAPWSERLEWLGARHMEHRFPLARASWLVLLDSTGHDFRAAMWLTVLLLSAAAAVLMLAARGLRGRTSFADAVFPVLFLHPGHAENLLMGYQIAFTLTVGALAVFALLIACSNSLEPSRAALLGSVLLVPIALGGWLGLVFVPPLALWVGWQWWRARGPGLPAVAILAAVLGYLAWSVWFLLTNGGVQHVEAVPDPATRVKAVASVMGLGFGSGIGRYGKPAAFGAVLILVQAATAVVLARVGLRRSDERPAAWGLLALLLGVWAFAFAVGFSRGAGLASRYAAFSSLGIIIPLLALARFARPSACLVAAVGVGGVLLVAANARHGALQGTQLDERYRGVVADVAAGIPIDLLAERHHDFWLGPEDGWRALWDNGFPLLRGVRAAGSREVRSLPVRRDGELSVGRATFARYRIDLANERPVMAVRVRFRAGMWVPWERMMFDWIDATTGERRRSEVRPWVRPIKQSAVFWIDGPLAAGDLLIGRPDCPIEVLGVELLALPG